MSDDNYELQRLRTPKLTAPRLSGDGEIDYNLLIDGHGRLYVKLVKNSGSGKLSPLAFRVDTLLQDIEKDAPQFIGFSSDGISGPDTNQNSKSFLKAVANHLLSKEVDASA